MFPLLFLAPRVFPNVFLYSFVLTHHSYTFGVEGEEFVCAHFAILFRGPGFIPDFMALVLTVPREMYHGIYGS